MNESRIKGIIRRNELLDDCSFEYCLKSTGLTDLLTSAIPVLTPDNTVRDALSVMTETSFSSVVAGINRHPVGILTSKDINRIILSGSNINNVKLGKIMSHPVSTADINKTDYDAIEQMTRHEIRRLIVVDDEGLIAGMVTYSYLCRGLVKGNIKCLNRSSHELILKNKIADAFLLAKNEDVYNQVLQNILTATQSRRGIFCYMDEDGNYTFCMLNGGPQNVYRTFHKNVMLQFDPWKDIWAKLQKTQKPFMVKRRMTMPGGQIPIKGAVVVPIRHGGYFIGCAVAADKPVEYTEDDGVLMESMARYVAPIMHARHESEWNKRKRTEIEHKVIDTLREKSLLVEELNCRVKNTLQLIYSLLNLQKKQSGSDETDEVLSKFQNRIRAISLVHEDLSHSDNIASIKVRRYVNEMVKGVFRFYEIDTQKINSEVDVSDISLDLKNAIPFGLIISELVTNSLHHAFPDNGGAEIRVSVHAITEDLTELVVYDNGIGLPNHIDPSHASSLGLQIVEALVSQLKGRLEIDRSEGTLFRIEFPGQA